MLSVSIIINYWDVILLLGIIGVYTYVWYCRYDEDIHYDLEIFVQSTRAGLTATSILLPGAFLAAGTLSQQTQVISFQLYFGSVWFVISILCGIFNLFRLPTIVGRETSDNNRPVRLSNKQTILVGLVQLSSIVLGSVRTIFALNL